MAEQDPAGPILQAPLAELPARPRDNLPSGYAELLEQLKARIHAAQTRAAAAVNHELVLLYWSRRSFGKETLRGGAAGTVRAMP